ncbi:hypothetical protein RDMS_06125 [Deinococcus sp. RL]|uniref:hypothetical protein n=1 Tax=Deinococcus sp. RL TaxID=1489678 RepID=UPI0004D76E05|nr:hypothetical protein [Deinococcus sp. RL]KEF34630.1 hypothetical protein RDMS_06125 [Deinococcus sp. RL]
MFPTKRVLLAALALGPVMLGGLGLGGWAQGASTPFPYLRTAARPIPAPQPGERPLLRLEGRTQTLTLTRSQLLALPTVRYATRHAQLGRTFTYEGVPLRDLARLGGFAGQDMQLHASNGYMTIIAARDYEAAPIMLAHTADGKPIPVLEKGPLAVVLPPDERRFPRSQYGSAWVWFVERISPAP